MALDKNLFRNWVNGEVFNASDYVYERNLIIDEINSLPSQEVLLASVANLHYTKEQLDPEAPQNNNVLDLRYYTLTDLDPAAGPNQNVLDARYYTKTLVNNELTADRDRLAAIETIAGGVYNASDNPNGLIGNPNFPSQWFDQPLKKADEVEFASVKLGTKTLNQVAITALENKYTTEQANANFVAKTQLGEETVEGENGYIGVATLDINGRIPVEQLPIDTVIFQGTFGEGLNDLPTGPTVLSGHFYICTAVDSELGYYASAVAGINFYVGDKAIFDGTNWNIIDNTETVTSVNNKIGSVTLTHTDVGAAAASHTHGNITNVGAIGDTTNLVVITGEAGVLTTAGRGGIDSRSSFPPASHTHGTISNDGKIGSTDDQVVVTGPEGVVTTATREGIDSRSAFPPSDHNHDGLYYRETELNPLYPEGHESAGEPDLTTPASLDGRYYTEEEVDSILADPALVPVLVEGKIPASQLPSYVDDVIEGYYDSANDLFYEDAGFTELITPLSGKIFVNLTNKKIYRYSGSGYIEIAANSVNSVNGQTGVVTLSDANIAVDATGFTGSLTTDATNVELALAELDAHSHDFVDITNKPALYTEGEVDALLANKVDVGSLSAGLTFYPTNTYESGGDFAGYAQLVTSISDNRYNDTAVTLYTTNDRTAGGTSVITSSDPDNPNIVGQLIADAGVVIGDISGVNTTTVGQVILVNNGSSGKLRFKIYKSSDMVNPIAVSGYTERVTNLEFADLFQSALIQNTTFGVNDRFVIIYEAYREENQDPIIGIKFGGPDPTRTLVPVPLATVQSALAITYDPTSASISSTNLQDAVDELDTLIQQNTSVIKVQRFVINNADNGNGTFTYTYNGGDPINGTLAGGVYTFDLQNGVEYIVGQNRVEVKVNNDITYYAPDAEMTEVDVNTIAITHPFQANDEIFFKVYQGLDSVAIQVEDGTITTAKLSSALQTKVSNGDTAHGWGDHSQEGYLTGVTAADVSLEKLTNDKQVKALPTGTPSVDGNIPIWNGTAGDALNPGYGVQTELSSSTTHLVRADAIQTALNGKQDPLVSGTNIKTLNGQTILGSGDYIIDIPSVDVSETAPDIQEANVGDLWWDSTSAVLYIAYDDGTSKQWVEVSYASVQEAINNLVASAPEALDTLNELAAALGDDPNFATTISTAIAAKADASTVAAKADKLATFVTVSADYTILTTDAGKILQCTNDVNTNITLTVPDTTGLAVGSQIAVLANGAGSVTFAPDTNVNIVSLDSSLTISGQYASAALLKIASDTWQLVGSLA